MFKLSKDTISEIIFAMENDTGQAFVRLSDGRVIFPEASDEEIPTEEGADDLANPPEWSSAQGFRVMESFAESCKDQELKKELFRVLRLRRGVFKAFKESLRRYPEDCDRFYAYKDAAMEARVREWYAQLRSSWDGVDQGLDELGQEAFLLEDWGFPEAMEAINALFDSGDMDVEAEREDILDYIRDQAREPATLRCRALRLNEGPGGRLAGIAFSRPLSCGRGASFCFFLWLRPEYRDLGLAERLARACGQGPLPLLVSWQAPRVLEC